MAFNQKLVALKQEKFQRLTILFVVPGEYSEALKEVVQIVNKESYDDRFIFHYSEHVEDILIWLNEQGNSPDYIFTIVNPTVRTCLDIAEEMIRKVDQRYLQGGRLCLVNGHCSAKPVSEMAIAMGTINVISQKYSILLINGDVMIPDKCKHLVTRMISLAASVCGYHTGIPISIDLPGYDHMFR